MDPLYLIIAALTLISLMVIVFLILKRRQRKKGLSLEQLFKALDEIDKPPMELKKLAPIAPPTHVPTEDTTTLIADEEKSSRWNVIELVFMIAAVLNGLFLIWFFRKDLHPFEFSSISTIILYVLVFLIGFCIYRIIIRVWKGINP